MVAADTAQLNNPNSLHCFIFITLICACFLLQEKYCESGKHEQKFEESKNELKIQVLPSAASQMPYSGTKEYNEELHLMSDRYLATLQTVLEKLSNHLELQLSS
jgi:hypothetical protein